MVSGAAGATTSLIVGTAFRSTAGNDRATLVGAINLGVAATFGCGCTSTRLTAGGALNTAFAFGGVLTFGRGAGASLIGGNPRYAPTATYNQAATVQVV